MTRLSRLGPAEAGPRWCWALKGPNTGVFHCGYSCLDLSDSVFCVVVVLCPVTTAGVIHTRAPFIGVDTSSHVVGSASSGYGDIPMWCWAFMMVQIFYI